MSDPTVVHEYLSTACVHGLMEGHATSPGSPTAVAFHQLCRRTCKWCASSCSCPCHDSETGVAV